LLVLYVLLLVITNKVSSIKYFMTLFCFLLQWMNDKIGEKVLLMEETVVPTSHWLTLSHNVVSSTLVCGIQTHNLSGNRHWL
jgi:hypothetical protein